MNTENKVTIKTNNVPRATIYGYELSEVERKDFDYLEEDALYSNSFFRYKGQVYDLSEFLALNRYKNQCYSEDVFGNWDGYMSDSFFSGILVKYCQDPEFIIVATYYR